MGYFTLIFVLLLTLTYVTAEKLSNGNNGNNRADNAASSGHRFAFPKKTESGSERANDNARKTRQLLEKIVPGLKRTQQGNNDQIRSKRFIGYHQPYYGYNSYCYDYYY